MTEATQLRNTKEFFGRVGTRNVEFEKVGSCVHGYNSTNFLVGPCNANGVLRARERVVRVNVVSNIGKTIVINGVQLFGLIERFFKVAEIPESTGFGDNSVEARALQLVEVSISFTQWTGSITDFKILKAVDQAGGLAIAFNANQYALPYATMSLASTSINDLLEVLKEWQKSGRSGVAEMVKEKEKAGGKKDRDNFHWLADKSDIYDIISLHKRIRQLVREEAGKLG